MLRTLTQHFKTLPNLKKTVILTETRKHKEHIIKKQNKGEKKLRTLKA